MIMEKVTSESRHPTWRYRSRRLTRFAALLLASFALIQIGASSMELTNIRFVESNGSRLVATSNSNYAFSSPKLASKNWRMVSVNGDSLVAISQTGERVPMLKTALSPTDLVFIEGLRDEIASGPGGLSLSSTSTGGIGSSYMSTSSFSSSSSGGGSQDISQGGMSYSLRDPNNFSLARSDLPFNWARVFYNDDTITLVYRNGDVQMQPVSLLEPAQVEAVNKLKAEIAEMQRVQANSVKSSMNMVSSVFDNIMSRFPRPPSYQSAVGGMFGNNFPFGPNNSPFDSATGWPFGAGPGGAGTGAAALALVRRR